MDRCWAFCLAYNEATLIPYWVAHYRAFCERVVVYVDADSDDGTGAIALAYGAEVRLHHTTGLDDVAFVRFAEEHYKEARGRAEWVVWVDADEFLYHPRMKRRLARLRAAGVSCPKVEGYQMVGDAPPSGPRPITAQIKKGIPAKEYSKVCVFSPELDVAWEPGKHTATVSGPAPTSDGGHEGTDPLKLLHYRYLGEAWLTARNTRNFARMPAEQLGRRHGVETYPDHTGVYSAGWYAEQTANAQEVVG
jgi:glycosyltransferase involved in cell wall biosynthesis